jgi:hypothetical protein
VLLVIVAICLTYYSASGASRSTYWRCCDGGSSGLTTRSKTISGASVSRSTHSLNERSARPAHREASRKEPASTYRVSRRGGCCMELSVMQRACAVFAAVFTAHEPGMDREQPAAVTPLFCAVGHLTGGAIWTASDLPALVEALIGDPQYRSRSLAGRLTARENCSFQLATRSQAGLIQAALADGTWSFEGASSNEIDRLTRARQIADSDGAWRVRVPLILVKPADPSWTLPKGLVKVISPRTDRSLIVGMVGLGWLLEASRLDSAGGVDESKR